jgi:5-hydroxyisourate hydrolase-like protein (transthyretin family)
MKNLIILILSIFTLSFLVSCDKDDPILPTIVNGQVLEQGSNKPLEGVKVVLMEGTYNGISSGTYSFYPIDTFLTDANGRYSYEHKILSSRKIYELWYFKSTYFDISNVGENDKVTSVEENKTKSVVTKMSPFAWLKIRVINDKPLDDSDILSIRVTDQERDFFGDKINQTFIEKVRGNRKQKIHWIIQRNLKWGQGVNDSIYCKGHDTTYYQLRY